MFRRIHGRCWVVAAPGTPEESAPHRRTEDEAAELLTTRLIKAVDEHARGHGDQVPYEDLWQRSYPCWQLSCEGCRRVLRAEGTSHFPSKGHAAGAACRAGWDHYLLLCPRCRELVTPLHPSDPILRPIPRHAS